MAEKYIDDLSRNVKRGNRAKLERGGWPNKAPPGYLNDRLTKTIIVDPIRFPLVRRAFDLYLTSRYSVPAILRRLNDEWGYRTPQNRRLSRSDLFHIFNNPFFTGTMEFAGATYVGSHPPMLTEAEFWRVQELLGRRGRHRSTRRSFAYTGMIRCGECGAMITAETKTNRYGSRYTYYHCTWKKPCAQPSAQLGDLERQIEDFLSRLALPPIFLEWAFDHLADTEQHEVTERRAMAASVDQALGSLERQISTLTQMRARDLITDAEFLRERQQIQNELFPLRAQKTSKEPDRLADATAETFILAARAREWFRAGASDTRREILDTVGSNLVLKDKILTVEAKTPFRIIENGPSRADASPERFEPPKDRLTIGDFVDFASQKMKLLAVVDAVRTSLRSGVGTESLPTRRRASVPRVPFTERVKQILRTAMD